MLNNIFELENIKNQINQKYVFKRENKYKCQIRIKYYDDNEDINNIYN